MSDFNHDGKPDVLTSYNPNTKGDGSGVPSYALLLNKGDGTFTLDVLTNVVVPTDPTAPTDAHIADVNGDGKPDLIVMNGGPVSGDASKGPAVLYVYLGNGDGTFRPLAPQVIFSNMNGGVNAAVDLNGDGKADIIVSSFGYNQFPSTTTI